MNKKEYKEYLKTKHWKKAREQRLKIDGYVCSVCKSNKRLQVHHLTYENIHNEDVFTDLITLCEDCHAKVHKKQIKLKKKNNKKNKKQRAKKGKVTFKKIKGICKFTEKERNKIKPLNFLINI